MMGVASKIFSVILRVGELVSSAIVLGILGRFLYLLSSANIYADARVVYATCVASIGVFASMFLMPPFTYSFLAFPFDFVMFVMWLVAFCILQALTGINTCGSSWYWSYWGYYVSNFLIRNFIKEAPDEYIATPEWGGYWRTPIIVTNPVDIAWAGCSSWRAVLGWSFIASMAFFSSALLGACVIAKYREEIPYVQKLVKSEKTKSPPPPNGPRCTRGTKW